MDRIDDIKKEVKKVSESLSHFMETGHLADNISHLTTNASILKILAKELREIKDNDSKEMSERRVVYFGTDGSAGHIAIPITGEFSNEELRKVESIDSDSFYRIFRKNEFKMARFENYTILGFPASPDDDRGGGKTVVMIEEEATEVDFIILLNSVPFLEKQFNKLAKMFKISIWN